VFSLGLILVVVGGAELLTGNMALIPMAAMQHRVTLGRMGVSLVLVLIGNLLGSVFVAYFLAVKTGVVGTPSVAPDSPGGIVFSRLTAVAKGKAITETNTQIFLRAMGCNWLVCLGVWLALAAEDVAGKILGIFFPIMAFVALGFDHVVANMFFLPAAIWAHAPGIGWGDVINNWGWALLGNFVGAAVFVATFYWYLYLREAPVGAPAGGGRAVTGDARDTPAARRS
jgi:formate transporter